MVNKSVKISGGKYDGLAGTVEKVGKNSVCLVKIAGVANGQPVNAAAWIKGQQLEVL